MIIHPIAHINTDFPEKFGIPRQSNLVEALEGQIIFTPEYRNPDYLRGIEVLRQQKCRSFPNSASSPPGRQCTHGRFRNQIPLSAKSPGSILCQA